NSSVGSVLEMHPQPLDRNGSHAFPGQGPVWPLDQQRGTSVQAPVRDRGCELIWVWPVLWFDRPYPCRPTVPTESAVSVGRNLGNPVVAQTVLPLHSGLALFPWLWVRTVLGGTGVWECDW